MQQGPGGARAEASIAIRANTAQPAVKSRRLTGRSWSYTITSWLGLVPFLLFCLLFEILPAIIIIQGSFTDNTTGALTLDNYHRMLSQASNLHAFQTSISISIVTALLGGVIGGLAAYGVYNLRTGWLRNFLIGFSSIAANFAGVPLAFAFVATLGASNFTYWRRVGLPILLPSLIAATMLLFANSFGAFATAFSLAQDNINLVPILINFVVNGNVTIDFGLGNALAVGMIIVLLVAVSLYTAMLRRVSVWQGR